MKVRGHAVLILIIGISFSIMLVGCSGGGGGGGGGAGNSGIAIQVSKEIGPTGGEVEVTNPTSPLYGTKLIVPNGALEDIETISISTKSIVPAFNNNLNSAGKAIDFGPDGRFIYNRENGRDVVPLLRKWSEEQKTDD